MYVLKILTCKYKHKKRVLSFNKIFLIFFKSIKTQNIKLK